MTTDNLIAAAAMAAAANAQAEAVRRTSLCMATAPQMSGLLDSMVLDNMGMQSPDVMSSAGAALAMQSALYSPAAPALDAAQLQAPVASAALACAAFNMQPSPAAMAQRSPARHSLDCSMLSLGGGGMVGGGLPSPAGHMSGIPSPVCTSRTSISLPQAPMMAERSLAMAAPAPQSDASGWGFSSRRAAAGRASCDVRASHDVRRVSSDICRSHTPAQHEPPRKSVSMICNSACSSSSASSTSSNSGRSSPRGKQTVQQQINNARRASMDRPPTQPIKRTPSALSLAAGSKSPAPAGAEGAAGASARKGTGVFIPACMLKQ